jgi:acetyl-CoA carboxylase beta subunit
MTTMAEHNGKASSTEEEYFAREDAEKKRKLSHQVKKETEVAEQARLKALHWMRCPKCGMQMHEVRMRGVDVDVCFSCNGIFLDQGELERLQTPEHHGVMAAILNWFNPEPKK